MTKNYFCKFINFFKSLGLYDKKVFDHIWNNSCFYNYLDDEYRKYTGIYYIIDKNKRLLDFNLVVPFISSEETLLINIHEYIHAIDAYYKLGKKAKVDNSVEIMSLLFEKIYLLETKNEQLESYEDKLNEIRININNDKYVLGLKVADELLNHYDKNITLKELSKKSKKLLRKYKYLK